MEQSGGCQCCGSSYLPSRFDVDNVLTLFTKAICG